MGRHVLVTGGAGFIGSHLVDAILADPDSRVTVLDRLSVGGSRENLAHLGDDGRLRLVVGDVRDAAALRPLVAETDAVVHAVAESHVDRSIAEPGAFLDVNAGGTLAVLEACREAGRRLLMVSTDEVYGPNPGAAPMPEDAPLRPRSPYAASKAAADLLCQAWRATYGLDVTIVRGTNAYGPRQVERVVPTFAIAALRGEPLPLYGSGEQRREFLHVEDWARGLLVALDRGAPGEVYNIGSGTELANVDLARRILALVGAPPDRIVSVPDRPGHDARYGVADGKLRALGWAPRIGFDDGLAATVAWYRANLDAVVARTP
ncbi:MAG: dTDP-glucose 4,6-dehydratase [Actinomycetota bacterium]